MAFVENRNKAKVSRSGSLGLVRFLARVTFYLLTAIILYGLIVGAIIVLTFVDRNASSPEFSWSAFAYILTVISFMVVLVLSLPGLLVGLWNLVRGNWRESWSLLSFFGPFSVIAGFEIASHLIFMQCDLTPWLCEPYYDAESGKISDSITGQWHLLHHSAVASLFMVVYWLVLRKWQPKLI